MNHNARPRALARITGLDLTRVRAGPACVRQFGDCGAHDFKTLHRNKRSTTLDLKRPDGVAILKRMVERADILVETFRPDVKHRLGIDYETLSGINLRLIYASISG